MKLNQKGFAITIMLYSVLTLITMIVILILTTMSGVRKSNATLTDNIKDDLNNAYYSKNETFEYTGEPQEFDVIKSGYYKIELWGASGAYSGTNPNAVGGKGAYTSGIIYLNAGQKLYFYVGQAGIGECTNYEECTTPIFNGGGLGGYYTTETNKIRVNSGGGATDVRLEPGAWDDISSLKSRIMVAAGGGATDDRNTGSNGGALVGEKGIDSSSGAVTGSGGTQTNGGTSGRNAGLFGRGGDGYIPFSTIVNCNESYGAGGGYYGGGGGQSGDPNQNPIIDDVCAIRGYSGGGSSFISGYAGVNAVQDNNIITHSNNTIHYSNLYFIKGAMNIGVQQGAGRAIIKYAGDEIERKNSALDNVRYIRDCINGSSVDSYNQWIELQAIQNGRNIALNKTVTSTGTAASGKNLNWITNGNIEAIDSQIVQLNQVGNRCITVDLNSSQKLDEIAVWHNYSDTRTYNSHTLSVSSDNSNWVDVINNLSNEVETSNGIHVNAFQSQG